MKNYDVTLYYHTSITVNVFADNEEDAIEQAREIASRDDDDILDEIFENMIEDDGPDIEEYRIR